VTKYRIFCLVGQGSHDSQGSQGSQVSISPIFYEQLFHAKAFCATFMCLQFGFVIFWQKNFGTKADDKMLVKLTPGQPRHLKPLWLPQAFQLKTLPM
jgi:hypothetical protein